MNLKLPYISLTRLLFKLPALVLAAVNNLFQTRLRIPCTVKDNLGSSCLEHKVCPRCDSKRFTKKTLGFGYQTWFLWFSNKLTSCLCIHLSRNADGRCHDTGKLLKYDNVKITSTKLAILNCNEIKYILNNISGQHLIMIKK